MFVRLPVPGAAKTRLAPALGRAGAARLYRAFVEDLCAALSPHFAMALACTPDPAAPYFRRLARRFGVALLAQGPGDLGARMERVARGALARARRVVLIGSDAPTLPVAQVRAAFALLRRHRVVIGPSLDGGYHLLGVRSPLPPVFARMPWSSDRVLARTLARLRRAGIRAALAPCWYDVDEPADVGLLARHLAVQATTGVSTAPRARRALAALREGAR